MRPLSLRLLQLLQDVTQICRVEREEVGEAVPGGWSAGVQARCWSPAESAFAIPPTAVMTFFVVECRGYRVPATLRYLRTTFSVDVLFVPI